MRVALDSLGDFPLEPLVTGAVTAARANPDLRITFLGDEARLEPFLQGLGKVSQRLDTFPCSQFLTSDDDLEAHRIKPDASLLRGWQLLMERNVEGLVTTGPPQALLAAALRWNALLPNVRSPILHYFNQSLNVSVAAGNHPTPRADYLYQWGVMGLLIAGQLGQHVAPRIRLSSNLDLIRVIDEAHRYFRESPWRSSCMGTTNLRDATTEVTLFLSTSPMEFPHASLGCLTGSRGISLFTAPTAESVEKALQLALTWQTTNLNQQIIDELAHGPL